MSLIQRMDAEIEFLMEPEPQETVEQPQQPMKLVEPVEEMPPSQQISRPPAETPPPLPLTAEQGEDILRLLRALPTQAAREIVTQTEPLRQRLGKATDHAMITRKAMESLAALVERLRAGTEESRAAAAQMPAAAKDLRREGEKFLRQSVTQMSEAVASERAAIRRDLSQIPTVRRYFVLCLLSVLLSSAISGGLFGLAWQQSRPDPMTLKAGKTFHGMWERASAKERRQIEEIITRPLPRPQVQR